MAFRNPAFNPQLEKHLESTTEDYYEIDTSTPKNLRHGRQGSERNVIEFDDINRNREEGIYQQLAFPRPVKVVTEPARIHPEANQQSASNAGPTQGSSVATHTDGRSRGKANKESLPGKRNGGLSHLHGDTRCCMLNRQCLVVMVFLILFLLLLLVLIILLITGKIGNRLNMNQGSDHCLESTCKNGGTCLSLEKDYACLCAAGWKGINCTISTDHCLGSQCENGGTCLSLEKDYFCVCAAGWKGINCTTNIDDCASNPCKNGGNCMDLVNDYNCSCTSTWYGKDCDLSKRDCASIKMSGATTTGSYTVNPDGKGPIVVYCDMVTRGGGWTVIQRRINGSVDFYLDWNSYKGGFGTLSGEFWLGNDNIHRLTAVGNTVLRVELEDWHGDTAYAVYHTFFVDGESKMYKLTVGSYSGTAGNALGSHNGMLFTTKDRDNDLDSGNCAQKSTGAYWYGNCYHSNLNGQYLGDTQDTKGITWYYWKNNYYSMKRSTMMIRPH